MEVRIRELMADSEWGRANTNMILSLFDWWVIGHKQCA